MFPLEIRPVEGPGTPTDNDVKHFVLEVTEGVIGYSEEEGSGEGVGSGTNRNRPGKRW